MAKLIIEAFSSSILLSSSFIDSSLFFRGLVLGFSIAAPVGPIGVLCIRRTLAGGRLSGFLSGLGAATADAVYGCIAVFGLTFISSLLVAQQFWLRLAGGGFLLYLGARTFLARAAEKPAGGAEGSQRGYMGDYLSTFGLTLTNPMTILSFAAVFAGLGLGEGSGGYTSAALMAAGVFLGSAAWWLALSGGVGMLRGRIKAGWFHWVNKGSGLILLFFGAAALLSL